MKVTKFKEELKNLSSSQLKEKLDDLQREFFGLRLSVQTAHVKNYARFKQLKRNIARILTFMQQNSKSSVAAEK